MVESTGPYLVGHLLGDRGGPLQRLGEKRTDVGGVLGTVCLRADHLGEKVEQVDIVAAELRG